MPPLEPLKPPPLEPGAPIALLSPSGPAPAAALDAAVARIEGRGHPVRLGRNAAARRHYLAGDDDQRAEDLHAAFADPAIQAIFCSRGGYGSSRLLDRLDMELIRQHPKIVVGFSDTTALHLGLWARTGLVGLTGCLAAYDLDRTDPFTADALWHALEAAAPHTADELDPAVQVLRSGQTRGRLLGGCLSLVVHLLGTPYQPDFTGALLLLEDVGEAPYRVDRMLCQLRLAGVLDRIGGLILGQFKDCAGDDDAPTIAEIALEHLGQRPIPVIEGFPYGHFPRRLVLPLGLEYELDTAPPRLRCCEGAFAQIL